MVGDILEQPLNIKTDYDYRILAECGPLIAIQPIKRMVYKSYATVAAGLSLNPIEYPIAEPVQWYVKDELMKFFRIKEQKA